MLRRQWVHALGPMNGFLDELQTIVKKHGGQHSAHVC